MLIVLILPARFKKTLCYLSVQKKTIDTITRESVRWGALATFLFA